MDKKITLSNDDNFGNNFPVRAYRVSKGWPSEYHAHEYMQIWYIVKGSCTHTVDDKNYNLVAGNLLVIPPMVYHGIHDEKDDFTIICCEFDFKIISHDNIFSKNEVENLLHFTYTESFLSLIESTRPCYTPSKLCRVKLELMFDEIINECEKDRPYKEVSLKSYILSLLVLLARDYENMGNNIKAVKSYSLFIEKALSFINENFNKKIYIEDAAKIASMSESYFSYFFKEHTGKTFKEYITMLKIDYAKEQLIKSSNSITQIALNAGFSDCAHFNKVFKKEEGITPLNFRRRHF